MAKKRIYKKGVEGNEYSGKKRDGTKRKFTQKGNSKNRALNNAANRAAKRAGKIKKGDNKVVDHREPLVKGGSNNPSNLRVVDKGTNSRKGKKSAPRRVVSRSTNRKKGKK